MQTLKKPVKSAPQKPKARTQEKPTGTDLWLLLMKAHHALAEYAAQTRAGSGLGDSDFRVLEALLHKGPLPVNDIGAKVFLTPGSISTAVDRLYQQGLVTREEAARDRRIRLVDLTPKGRTLIQRVFHDHALKMDALADHLEPKERRRLAEGLKAFGKSVTAAATKDHPDAKRGAR